MMLSLIVITAFTVRHLLIVRITIYYSRFVAQILNISLALSLPLALCRLAAVL